MSYRIPSSISVYGWRAIRIAKGIFELTPNDFYITQTGSDVNTDFLIEHSHRLMRLAIKHTTSANIESTDPMNIILQTREAKGFTVVIWSTYDDIRGSFSEKLGETYEYLPMNYQLTTNSTNTDRIYPIIKIQLLE